MDPELRKNMEIFIALLERGESSLNIPIAWASLTAAIKGSTNIQKMLSDLLDLGRDIPAEYTQTNLTIDERLRHLNTYFSEILGFHGNMEAYGDPANSYLDDVLSRRLGIPISLCMIFIELGKSFGLDIDPIGFPAHFLVRERTSGIICDPFFNRVGLTQKDCLAIVTRIFGHSVAWNNRFMNVTSKANILIRMLNNLRNNFFANNDNKRLLITDKILERLSMLDVPNQSATLN